VTTYHALLLIFAAVYRKMQLFCLFKPMPLLFAGQSDCTEILSVYTVYIGPIPMPVQVYCDTATGEGWTVCIIFQSKLMLSYWLTCLFSLTYRLKFICLLRNLTCIGNDIIWRWVLFSVGDFIVGLDDIMSFPVICWLTIGSADTYDNMTFD